MMRQERRRLDGRGTRAETPGIDDAHRRALLRFLLVKTAAVRRGVKPAELLRKLLRFAVICLNWRWNWKKYSRFAAPCWNRGHFAVS